MQSPPEISVIIATLNRRALLERTFPTVVDQDLHPRRYEVVVVLDGCTDETAEFLRNVPAACNVRIVEQAQNQGQSRAANIGAQAAHGEFLLFLDDDLICERSLVRLHLEAHKASNREVLVFGPVPVSNESPATLATEWTRQATRIYTEPLDRTGVPIWPDNATVDANSSLSRRVFLEYGGFDETLHSARQNEELGIRLWHGGLGFTYVRAAVTQHIFTKSNHALAVLEGRAHGRAEVRMMRKLPYARERSHLPAILESPLAKRQAYRFLTGMALSLEPVLRPACGVAQILINIQIFKKLGLRIMDWRRSIEFHRAAAREAGGVRTLAAEFWSVLPVLMYHHIGPRVPGTNPILTVTPSEFEGHIRWLKRQGYTTILPADWLDYCLEGKVLPSKPVLLTFDDAYADLAEYCFPVLEKNDCKAVVFVPTSDVGGSNTWDQASWPVAHRLLSAEQIARAATKGIDFGAHTRTHPDLQHLKPGAMDIELEGSKHDLERILGRRILSFAYPYGHYGDREVEHAHQQFALCFTTDEGKNILTTDRGRLRRIMVYPGGWHRLSLCLSFGFDPIRRLRERVQLRTRSRRLWQALQFFQKARSSKESS
jgi:peptidoglycan/xylan/chitin deacetylase (PgdA/CDA1 family)/glycosyltransferase involved in cell wall biosynthesis